MFYVALCTQLVFFVCYNFFYTAQTPIKRIWRIAEGGFPLAGLILGIEWIIILSYTAFAIIAFDLFMKWVTPSSPYTGLFTLKNIRSGKVLEQMKNIPPEDRKVTFRKPVLQDKILLVICIASFAATLIYSERLIE